MKFFVAFAALMALTVAVPLGKPVDADLAQLEAIIAAINSPSTDPATAALLEEQLHDIISAANPIAVGPAIISPVIIPEPVVVGPVIVAPVVKPEPVVVGPVIIAPVVKPEPVAVGPAIIAPLPDLGAATAPGASSPVAIGEIPAGTSPLVQIIVNVNKATPQVPADIPVSPIVMPEPVFPIVRPEPIGALEIPATPVQVVEAAPEPVQVVEAAPEPVQVVEVAPVPVEPVQIGVPIIPEAAVILPEELN